MEGQVNKAMERPLTPYEDMCCGDGEEVPLIFTFDLPERLGSNEEESVPKHKLSLSKLDINSELHQEVVRLRQRGLVPTLQVDQHAEVFSDLLNDWRSSGLLQLEVREGYARYVNPRTGSEDEDSKYQ